MITLWIFCYVRIVTKSPDAAFSYQLYRRDIEDNYNSGYMDSQVTFRQKWNDERLAYSNSAQFSDIEFLTISPGS